MFQGQLIGGLDDIPHLDGVVAAGAGQNIVCVRVEGDISHLPVFMSQNSEERRHLECPDSFDTGAMSGAPFSTTVKLDGIVHKQI